MFDSSFFTPLLMLLLVQTIALAILWHQLSQQKKLAKTRQSIEKLINTKKQLHREIERHQETEIALQETQIYLQGLLDSMPTILIGVSPDGTVTHWNKSAEKASGLQLDDVYGKELQEVFPDLPIEMEVIHQTLESNQAQYKKNIKQGHGSEARYTDIVVYPLVISEEVEEAVVMATDVSMRVEIESRIMQSDKMHSLGEMAAGLAHEINNPLAGILHHVQNIQRRSSPELEANRVCAEKLGLRVEDIHQYLKDRNILSFLDNIKISGERTSQIVNNMLNFARSSPATFNQTDIAKLLENSVDLASNSFTRSQHFQPWFPVFETEIAPELQQIECSAVEIQQVLINLLRNSVQAFENDETYSALEPKIKLTATKSGTNLSLKIEDNGPGIREGIKGHIFEPFYTTKKVGQGTGLGLSVCYFIVKDHHDGDISVESEPGKGCRFTVTLPLSHTSHSNTSRALPLPPQLEPTEYPR